MTTPGYNPGAAEDPETNPEYAERAEATSETDGEGTTAHVGE
jgi:hypothetical protein